MKATINLRLRRGSGPCRESGLHRNRAVSPGKVESPKAAKLKQGVASHSAVLAMYPDDQRPTSRSTPPKVLSVPVKLIWYALATNLTTEPCIEPVIVVTVAFGIGVRARK